ncbi:MAG TPA: hypothetical protein DEP66_06275 [Acidimicrobiaceae bacterium]|nr:hypothetical protein [Acidimicrobiaceae bacterium]HCB37795.1 hypothetical protein [Acidimicrobiaceae bacterium]
MNAKQPGAKVATRSAAPSAAGPPAGAKKTPAAKRWRSRAVSRIVDAGNAVYCARCDVLIKFQARVRAEQIICNVYAKNKWDRVEHFHSECYEEAGSPYGEPNG